MASFNSTQFIEDALFCTTQFALSYSDPEQKWTIRNHLISLFQNCPYLKPSSAVFTHNDGTAVKLLSAAGELPVDTAPVPITIWVHELYPQIPPIVYVNLGDSVPYPIYESHPFVDPSGETVTSYLVNWDCFRSNLTDLVYSLIKVFNHNHPFYYSDDCRRRWKHPSALSWTEAMDRVASTVHCDLRTVLAGNEVEIRRLGSIQAKLQERANEVVILIDGLKLERKILKERLDAVSEESDRLLNWLKVYENNSHVSAIDEVFEALDGKSKALIECTATDDALEDLMYALDEAFAKGTLVLGEYMKQVRELAREQFPWRMRMTMIRGENDVVPRV